MILLKNGRVVDPESGFDQIADVLIKDDIVEDIAPSIEPTEDMQVIDCTGCIVGPGLVDIHVHFRDPGFTYKEDIYTGAKSAAAGGYTSVILMANTKPAVDNVDTLKYVIEKGNETDINVYTCANVTEGLKGEKLTDFASLIEAGAIGFTDDGIPILDESMARAAMEEAAKYDKVLSFHEEDPKYITNNGINRGKASAHFDIGGSDRMAEISMVERDIRLAMETGAKINIQHISAKETVELIREAKKNQSGSCKIYAEATPHHIALTEDAAIEHGTFAKMNPPLRTEEDRLAIIEGLKDDTIDFIATDHAPHSAEEKAKKITDAPSGIIGLETALSIAYTELVEKQKMPILKVLCKMSLNPARLYGINAGRLAKKCKADIVVYDTTGNYIYEKAVSKSSNTPFLNHAFKGRVLATICNGKIIHLLNRDLANDTI